MLTLQNSFLVFSYCLYTEPSGRHAAFEQKVSVSELNGGSRAKLWALGALRLANSRFRRFVSGFCEF